jgi:hypothetical protein
MVEVDTRAGKTMESVENPSRNIGGVYWRKTKKARFIRK